MTERPTYTRHARLRMGERRISEQEVDDVLANYHTSYTDREGNPNYVGHPGGRRIRVVVARDVLPPHIITVMD